MNYYVHVFSKKTFSFRFFKKKHFIKTLEKTFYKNIRKNEN